MNRVIIRLLPSAWFYADHLTWSARRLLLRMGFGVAGVVAGLVAAGLLSTTNWRDVLCGALLAWGVSIIIWSVGSYRHGQDEMYQNLRDTAELDLLHGRLNHLAARLGAPLLDLDSLIDAALNARMERLAHFGGLDEFRGPTSTEGHAFWDAEALGRDVPPTGATT